MNTKVKVVILIITVIITLLFASAAYSSWNRVVQSGQNLDEANQELRQAEMDSKVAWDECVAAAGIEACKQVQQQAYDDCVARGVSSSCDVILK